VSDPPPPLLVALDESGALGRAIAHEARVTLAPVEQRSFEEGEFKLRPLVSVRDRDLFVVQSLAGCADVPVAQRLVRLLFLLFGLRDAGARRLTVLIPYFAYARKDRRTQPRDPVNMRYVAQLLEATRIDRLIAVDVHNPAAFDNAFRIPTDHLSAAPMLVEHFARALNASQLVVASPDVGGIKRAQLFQELLERCVAREVGLAFIEKRRAAGVVSGGRICGEVAGRTVIVIDDLCASGGTLIRAAAALRRAGAAAVHVAVTHAPRPEGVATLLASADIAQIVLTDSVGTALRVDAQSAGRRLAILPIAPLLGQAVARSVRGAPLAPLLETWPLPAAP
jgi:ribose-phosphate pyrophosphokinase